MERRTFLSAGSVSALALTTGYMITSTDTASNGPTDPVEEYYRRANAADTREQFTAAIPDLAHDASPLPVVAESAPSTFDDALDQELLEADVVERDINADAIREISDFLAGSLSDEELTTLAEANAVVAVTLESDDVIGGELAKEWLVAPENDEWQLVWLGPRNSPRAATRKFFRQVSQTEFAGQLDELIEELVYPSSPLLNVAAYTPWYFRGIQRRELVGTDVVAKDISAGELASEFDPVTNWPSKTNLDAITDENAVVAVSLRDDQIDAEEFEQEWLLATTGGEWRVVWF